MTDIWKSEGKSEAIKGYVRILILYEQNYFPCGFHIVVIYHVPKPSSFGPPPFPPSQKNHNYQKNMIFHKQIFCPLEILKVYADVFLSVRLYKSSIWILFSCRTCESLGEHGHKLVSLDISSCPQVSNQSLRALG